MEKTIKIESGEVILISPTAGVRNKALMKAEEKAKDGNPSQTVFITEILPHCIKTHPFDNKPIRESLDNLCVSDYDKLALALGNLMKPVEDAKKK